MSMKIRLIPLNCKIPNLALMKLSAWHKSQGDKVSLDEPEPDVVYISSPFTSAKGTDRSMLFPEAKIEYGGYGFNNKQLPYEIEHIMPDYSIFNCDYSMGYTTRGCIRNCQKPPCIVPKMEGKLKRNSPIEEFHNPDHNKIMLLDNNIFADREWFFRNMDYIIEHKIKLDGTQGFDIRLLDEEIANYLLRIKFDRQIYFAFDSLNYSFQFIKGIELLQNKGIKPYRIMVYIYEKNDINDIMERFKLVLEQGCDPFVMPDVNATKNIKRFARFVNKRIYKVCEWSDYGRI